jgi:hypothetical protein
MRSIGRLSLSSAHQGACHVVKKYIDYRAGLIDDQKRRPKSHVGAQIRLPATTTGGSMKNALMITSADRLLPTASQPGAAETPAHRTHSLKRKAS